MALTKPYILVGGIVLFVALLFFFTKLPEIKLEEEEEVTAIVEEKPAASLWKRRQFVRSVVAQFCYCAAQTGIFGFFINYVTEMPPRMPSSGTRNSIIRAANTTPVVRAT